MEHEIEHRPLVRCDGCGVKTICIVIEGADVCEQCCQELDQQSDPIL